MPSEFKIFMEQFIKIIYYLKNAKAAYLVNYGIQVTSLVNAFGIKVVKWKSSHRVLTLKYERHMF